MEHALGLSWWKLLLGGFSLWTASVIVTAITGNFNMVPTVLILGSFLVPVSTVAWYLDHYHSDDVTPGNVFRAFVFGGAIGIFAASLLESWFLVRGPLVYLGVGLIEEAAKLLALILISRRLPVYGIRDGIVLGAAVGLGFAALESTGYAMTALIQMSPNGVVFSLPSLVFTELLRSVLTPFGHGLWTAVVGGVLFGTARGGRLRWTGGLALAYLVVSLLHGLWDSMSGIAAVITVILIAGHGPMATGVGGALMPSTDEVATYFGVEAAGLGLISLLAMLWLIRLWRSPAGIAVSS